MGSELTFTGSLTYDSKLRKAAKQVSVLSATGDDGTEYKLTRTTNVKKIRNKYLRTYVWQIKSKPAAEDGFWPIFEAEVKKEERHINDNLDIPAASKWKFGDGADRQRIVVSRAVKVPTDI